MRLACTPLFRASFAAHGEGEGQALVTTRRSMLRSGAALVAMASIGRAAATAEAAAMKPGAATTSGSASGRLPARRWIAALAVAVLALAAAQAVAAERLGASISPSASRRRT